MIEADDVPENSSKIEGRKESSCPNCGKARSLAYRPFCSRHCADVDLGKWLSESYAIRSEAAVDDAPSVENVQSMQDFDD